MVDNFGYIGVDLDGTLAEYTTWKGVDHIGPPVPKMLKRVLDWIKQGKRVKIFTARVTEKGADDDTYKAIRDWCIKHIGFELEITCKKDYTMVEFWDDRAVQVIPNTGERADGLD